MSSDAPRCLVLTGTIGAGKTTVAEAISVRLHRAGVRHGLLDLDWLGQVYPPIDPDDRFDLSLALQNLAVMTPNFRARGVHTFVIAATLTTRAELRGLEAALSGGDVTVARVVAPPEDVARRIESRDSGALRDDFLNRTEALAAEIARAGLDDFVLDNPDGGVEAAATEALDRLEWTR